MQPASTGVAVGVVVGNAVGACVGAFVGERVGLAVGACVGVFVGERVGLAVGGVWLTGQQVSHRPVIPRQQLLSELKEPPGNSFQRSPTGIGFVLVP